jgi:hypothetical protein
MSKISRWYDDLKSFECSCFFIGSVRYATIAFSCHLVNACFQVDVIQARSHSTATLHTAAPQHAVPSAPPMTPSSLEYLPADWSEAIDAASGRP